MFKKEAEDLNFKPSPILRSIKSFDYKAEKDFLML